MKEIVLRFKDRDCITDDDWSNVSSIKGLSEDSIREFKDKVSWSKISRYQTLSENFIREFKDKVIFSRPSIIFTRDIEPLHPCMSGVKKYLKIWDKDQEITWNEFIEKYADKGDIGWLANKLYINFLAGDLENRLESIQ